MDGSKSARKDLGILDFSETLGSQSGRSGANDISDHNRRLIISQSIAALKEALISTAAIIISPQFKFVLRDVEVDALPGLVPALEERNFAGKAILELRVTPNDRLKRATIVFSLGEGEVVNAAQVTQPGEMARLCWVLKEAAQVFLESPAERVIDFARRRHGSEEIMKKQEERREAELSKKLLSESLFIDDSRHRSDNLVEAEEVPPPLELD